MAYPNMQNVRNYLKRFDEILDEMENKMLSARLTNNITTTFIECMIPHHEAAIYMCENLLKYRTYPPLQKIAEDIIATQTRGIEQMKHIYMTAPFFPNTRQNVEKYITTYLSITKNMINKMRNSPRTRSINLNFVNEMIPHHEGAVEMCNNLLQYNIDPRLKKVAEDIIREQSKGIKQLEEVRRNLQRRY